MGSYKKVLIMVKMIEFVHKNSLQSIHLVYLVIIFISIYIVHPAIIFLALTPSSLFFFCFFWQCTDIYEPPVNLVYSYLIENIVVVCYCYSLYSLAGHFTATEHRASKSCRLEGTACYIFLGLRPARGISAFIPLKKKL